MTCARLLSGRSGERLAVTSTGRCAQPSRRTLQLRMGPHLSRAPGSEEIRGVPSCRGRAGVDPIADGGYRSRQGSFRRESPRSHETSERLLLCEKVGVRIPAAPPNPLVRGYVRILDSGARSGRDSGPELSTKLAHRRAFSGSSRTHPASAHSLAPWSPCHLAWPGLIIQTIYDLRSQGQGPRGFRVGRAASVPGQRDRLLARADGGRRRRPASPGVPVTRTGRPSTPIGTHGAITPDAKPAASWRDRVRDFDGRLRQVWATRPTAAAARARLLERVRERPAPGTQSGSARHSPAPVCSGRRARSQGRPEPGPARHRRPSTPRAAAVHSRPPKDVRQPPRSALVPGVSKRPPTSRAGRREPGYSTGSPLAAARSPGEPTGGLRG